MTKCFFTTQWHHKVDWSCSWYPRGVNHDHALTSCPAGQHFCERHSTVENEWAIWVSMYRRPMMLNVRCTKQIYDSGRARKVCRIQCKWKRREAGKASSSIRIGESFVLYSLFLPLRIYTWELFEHSIKALRLDSLKELEGSRKTVSGGYNIVIPILNY